MVSIEGRGGQRILVEEISRDAGWMVAKGPVKGCLFHVAPISDGMTRTSELARQNGIPIASYAEWASMAEQLGRVLAHEIAARI